MSRRQPSLFYIAWNDVRIHFTSPGARVAPVKTAMSRIALRINGIQFTSVALRLSHTHARKAVQWWRTRGQNRLVGKDVTLYTGIKYGDVLYISTKHTVDKKRERGERGRTISTDRNRQTKEQSDYIKNVTWNNVPSDVVMTVQIDPYNKDLQFGYC